MKTDYESDRILSEYLHFHFASREEYLPWACAPAGAWNYPSRIVSERLAPLWGGRPVARALDVGCAVGGTAFAMAGFAREVIGIDYSQRFITAAEILVCEGQLDYEFALQGDRSVSLSAQVPAGIERERVSFEVGDAQDLRDDLGAFDWVAAVNLLCRLRQPMHFLKRLPSLLNPGGLLLINSPFSWLEEFTPRENWLGGTAAASSAYALKGALEADFEFIDEVEMPFLIRETERKYQWTVAHSACWKRKS